MAADSMQSDDLLLEILMSDEDYSSSSESDTDTIIQYVFEIIGTVVKSEQRNGMQNYCEEVVPMYTDRQFISHFRVERTLAMDLTTQFAQSPEFVKLLGVSGNSRASITPEKHILTFLWFAGHQTASYRDVADRFDLSISSLFDVISRVSLFLSEMAPRVIKWPTQVQKQQIMDHYKYHKGFPGVIGSVDGSHIRIDKPSERPTDYFNRKDYHSMVLQGICDNDLNFLDVFIGYPGSVHDARIFKNSFVYPKLPQLCDGCYILGDSAYPLTEYVLTPYRDNGHLTGVQKNFNKRLSSCRVSIEHAFGVLKQRFRQLYHLKLRGHKRICHFIGACCVLHNIACKDDLQIFEEEEQLNDPQPDNSQDTVVSQDRGVQLRDELARQIFSCRGRRSL